MEILLAIGMLIFSAAIVTVSYFLILRIIRIADEERTIALEAKQEASYYRALYERQKTANSVFRVLKEGEIK